MKVVNSIVFKTVRTDKAGNSVYITIRLDDECGNGHEDFSITGSVYQGGKPKTDRYFIRGGAIGDYLVDEFPEFSIFNELHLCNFDGAPMYASIGNGFYHLKNSDKSVSMRYLMLTDEEYDVLKDVSDKLHLTYLLIDLGIVDRWNNKAKAAISLLEEWTNCKFESKATKSVSVSLSDEERRDIELKISNGYYSPNSIKEREEEKLRNKIKSLIEKEQKNYHDKITSLKKELEIKVTLLNSGLLDVYDNYIYYNHNNTISFNWKSYVNKVSEERIEEAKRVLSPLNVNFKNE